MATALIVIYIYNTCDKTQPLYLYNHLQLDMVDVLSTGF